MGFKNRFDDEPLQEEPHELPRSVRQRTVTVETKGKRQGRTAADVSPRTSSANTVDVVQKVRRRKLSTEATEKKPPPKVLVSPVVLPQGKK
ncbi:UNVERIFIED_ORG: hypothetical protein M2438_000421 [Methylobacterium sp. SuP10 SLI 274]|uniref:hypothetical protein n=1 Tax=Methylorubrum extorquens TaxID=408 RepID=UPI00209F9D18|nr:hypothetical protein [Methylorubrum extorquens]MDF9861619.1 hypothetical protein [Methylorubrum pseudosasae]MDH6635246.1 hypothetical protein [Methylobacterium sp. SuP10 SLI 274]MDH6664415.1 hypothetical protein [Methylorubrum zatmanii]MCP1561417.1 hypothetical protein [Methylorubrum extorquens]MDF9789912.1 hypothetical protein [Methylorubrum extorquens]